MNSYRITRSVFFIVTEKCVVIMICSLHVGFLLVVACMHGLETVSECRFQLCRVKLAKRKNWSIINTIGMRGLTAIDTRSCVKRLSSNRWYYRAVWAAYPPGRRPSWCAVCAVVCRLVPLRWLFCCELWFKGELNSRQHKLHTKMAASRAARQPAQLVNIACTRFESEPLLAGIAESRS